jgi:hypothetical protein
MKHQLINKNGEVVYLDDDSDVVPDGYGVRVHMMLQDMDPVQKSIATNVRVTDAWGAPAGHKPGYVFSQTQTQDAYNAREAYKVRLQDAWKTKAAAAPVAPVATRDPEAMYEARNAKLANAWRTGRGVAFGGGFGE